MQSSSPIRTTSISKPFIGMSVFMLLLSLAIIGLTSVLYHIWKDFADQYYNYYESDPNVRKVMRTAPVPGIVAGLNGVIGAVLGIVGFAIDNRCLIGMQVVVNIFAIIADVVFLGLGVIFSLHLHVLKRNHAVTHPSIPTLFDITVAAVVMTAIHTVITLIALCMTCCYCCKTRRESTGPEIKVVYVQNAPPTAQFQSQPTLPVQSQIVDQERGSQVFIATQ